MGKKSLVTAYFCWLFGGFFGLHHFYLRRDTHGLIWWMFGGGYFGIGWIRDFWRLPAYLRDANDDPLYMEILTQKMRKYPKPPTGTFRNFGMMLVADAFGYLLVGAIPRELVPQNYHTIVYALTVPMATAIGAHAVGNIGRHEASFKIILLGSYLSFPAYFFLDTPISLSATLACCAYNFFAKKWRRTPRKRYSLTRRITVISLCWMLYLSLWGSWLYFNCQIVYQDQEEVKCRDAAKHFFKSPIWREFVTVLKDIWNTVKVYGWREAWRQVVEALDPVGENHALKILGLNATSTQQEITSRYRKLSREWHPDKHQDPERKEMAQEKFIEIQQAYEILSKIKSERVTRNIKDPAKQAEMKEEL